MSDDLDIKPEMFWIDLETTGLDADRDRPLEIGAVLTDRYLRYVDTFHALIWEDVASYQESVTHAVDFVKDMHTKNGLFKDLDDPHTHKLTRLEVDRAILQWLHAHGVEKETLPMAGSSIGSLDRPFVLKHFTMLNSFLHYRNIDISSIKELCRMWRPDLLDALHDEQPSDAKWHRVLEDCEGSISEYKFYIQTGFIQIPTEEFVKIR